MTLAQPPVLFFDANTQDENDEVWENSGSAGGAVPQTDDHPTLEEGTVEVAGASFFTKYYTVPDSHAVFANDEPLNDAPEVFLENWTLELPDQNQRQPVSGRGRKSITCTASIPMPRKKRRPCA